MFRRNIFGIISNKDHFEGISGCVNSAAHS